MVEVQEVIFFPVISIANAIRERWSDAEILFVGAEDRMEMERVPAAGYRIIGLPVAGFDRRNMLKNVPVAMQLLRSMQKARHIIREFKPDLAVGVGGYASGPILKAASAKGVPHLDSGTEFICRGNQQVIGKKASVICVAYEGMEKYFPKDKIVLTATPVVVGSFAL